jgi:hypothetical protein
VDRFAARHGGPPTITVADGVVTLTAPDGELAECHAPPTVLASAVVGLDDLTTATREPIRLGVLLVRRGGFAVGVTEGGKLIASKVGSRYVQSRTAAGGWSQQRFARRRENQAKAAAGEVAEVCLRLLLPEAGRMTALVTGGDRGSVDTVLADQRLAALRPLVVERFLPVPDPRLAVLQGAVKAAYAVRIRLVPAAEAAGAAE